MPRLRGYSRKGLRCAALRDWGAKGRANVIGALFAGALIGAAVFDSTVNTSVFNGWIQNFLLPALPKNSVVIMDNAAFHKSAETKRLLEEAGHALLFLPPYSPDLNPIEHKWAQVKAIRRRTGATVEDLFKDHKM